ncbi:MAG: GNAT family N-acetyltransferase, partial [Candidatus Xenobia bacterium]
FAVRRPETLRFLLEEAATTAQRNGEAYLVVQLDPSAEEEQLFAEAGYVPDMLHVCKRIAGTVQTGREAEHGGYVVRPATEMDRMFVLHLNSLCGPFTIPPHRKTDDTEVGQRYLNYYVGLRLEGDPDFRVWIAEHEGFPVGFIMIKIAPPDPVSGEGVGYVYDIAIHPEHQGRLLSQKLVETAEAWLQSREVALLTGDISAANPRPQRVAEKYLGFSVELRRWAKVL